MPTMVNIRQDPFERTPSIGEQSLNDLGGGYMNDFYAREFWRFVSVQEEVAKLALTAIDYPPMQDPASFNLEAVKQTDRRGDQEQAGQLGNGHATGGLRAPGALIAMRRSAWTKAVRIQGIWPRRSCLFRRHSGRPSPGLESPEGHVTAGEVADWSGAGTTERPQVGRR